MAVDATNLNLFTPQLIQDRDMLLPCNNGIPVGAYNEPQMRYTGIPYAATNHQSYFNPTVVCDSVLQTKTSMNTDSGLSYNVPALPRKRSRESMNQLYGTSDFPTALKNNSNFLTNFAADDILPQIHNNHHFEIENLISQHTKKVRYEYEEKQKQFTRLIASSIGEGVSKKIKEKDDQIHKMAKLNLVLQERVKSLFVENQLLRDLAQSNEATANSLRSNLEQVLAHVSNEEHVVEDDVVSCCGSNDTADEGVEVKRVNSDRGCKVCGERESSVLLLPCRHLCLCNVCGSGAHQMQTCPVCNSVMNATLHVNLSS